MSIPHRITFQKLQFEDLPLIYKWLQEPHVHEWYEKEEEYTYEIIKDKYGKNITGESLTRGYLVKFEDKPFGYIQESKINDWPTVLEVLGKDSSAVAIDVFIGDPASWKRFRGYDD